MNWLESRQVHPLPLMQIDPAHSELSLSPPWSWADRPLLPSDYPHIVTPLLVQACAGGFRIVSGFRRFLSARAWGLETVPALLVAPWPEPELMAIVLAENRAQRDLTTLEMATVAGKLQAWGVRPEGIRQDFLPLLGFPADGHHLRRLMRLAGLAENLQRGLGTIEEEILLGISSWPSSDQDFLLDRLAFLRLGRNKQLQVWQLLDELRDLEKERSEPRLPEIWDRAGCRVIEAAETLSPADRYQSLLQALRRIRYPRLSGLEERQAQLTRELALPAAVHMTLPRFFEGERIEFRFSAGRPEELVRLAQALLEAGRCKEMAELFDLL